MWEAIAAIGNVLAATAAFATTFFIYKQITEMRFALRAQVTRDLERDFYNDAHMIKQRKEASIVLLRDKNKPDQDDTPEILEVINFVDGIGMLVRTKVIDDTLAFHRFGRRALAYWAYAKPCIDKRRKIDAQIVNDFDYLVKEMECYMELHDHPMGDSIWQDIIRRETELR